MGQITEEPYPSSVAVAYSFLNPQQAQFWFKYTVNMEFYVILHAENDKNSGSWRRDDYFSDFLTKSKNYGSLFFFQDRFWVSGVTFSYPVWCPEESTVPVSSFEIDFFFQKLGGGLGFFPKAPIYL